MFRFYSTPGQEKRLVGTLEINRLVYNYSVRNGYRHIDEMDSALSELKELHLLLRNYQSKMLLQMVSTRVSSAWKALEGLKKCRQEEKALKDKLRLLDAWECNSFIYSKSGFKIVQQHKYDKHSLFLSKLGSIETRLHKQPHNIKQVTVLRQDGNRWYAVVTCNTLRKIVQAAIKHNQQADVDSKGLNYAGSSKNNYFDCSKFLPQELKSLRRAHRKVLRSVYGSQNYKKATSWLQRLHVRIAKKCKNFFQNPSGQHSKMYDQIFVERLKSKSMNKNSCYYHHLATRSIRDSSWSSGSGSMFDQMVKNKANRLMECKLPNSNNNYVNCNRYRRTVLDHDYNSSGNIYDSLFKMQLQSWLQLQHLPMQHGKAMPVEPPCRGTEAGKTCLRVSCGQLTSVHLS